MVDDAAHVVTAKHVLDTGRKLAGAQDATFVAGLAMPNMEDVVIGGAVGVTLSQNFYFVRTSYVAEDESHDLALLRLDQNPFAGNLPTFARIGDVEIRPQAAPARLRIDRPRDGAPVAISGYPLRNDSLVTNSGGIASAWVTDPGEFKVTEPSRQDPGFGDRYLADLEVNGGNSGGPVYLATTGEVIGVCVATQNALVQFGDGDQEPVLANGRPIVYSSGLTMIIPAKYVVQLLEKNGSNIRGALAT